MKLRSEPLCCTVRGESAEEWVAHSLINTAARFLLRPLAASVLLSITLHSPLTFLSSSLSLSSSFFTSPLSMSYLANPHRPYDSPDPPNYALPPRNVLNVSSFDALNSHHNAQAPDQRLPKVGETRCCQYPITYFSARSIIHCLYIPAFFRFSSALCYTSPLTYFPFLLLLRLDTALRRPELCLPRPRPVLPSRRSSRPFNRTVLTQVCPPRRTDFCKERPRKCS
jgi:hypothetical protein